MAVLNCLCRLILSSCCLYFLLFLWTASPFADATATTSYTGVSSVNMSLLLSKTPLLSGTTLTSCDPSPNVSTCLGGLTTVLQLARQHAQLMNTTIIFIPRLDSLSEVSRLHPAYVGVNLLMYQRVQDYYTNNATRVNLVNYIVDPTAIVNGGRAFTELLHATNFKPMATSMVPPPNSAWRYVADAGRVIDLISMNAIDLTTIVRSTLPTSATSPKAAILFDDDSGLLWTTSSFVSPLLYGKRLNATYHTSTPFAVTDAANSFSGARVIADTVATLRRQVGFVVMISEDNSIPAVDLLADMLALEIEYEYLAQKAALVDGKTPDVIFSHVPDVHYQADIGRQTDPYPLDITATYIADDGTTITKTRSVLIAEMLDDSTSALNFEFNLTAVKLSTGAAGGTVRPDSMLLSSSMSYFNYLDENVTKDSIYFEDQETLLGYSREAIQNDPVVGSTLVAMPPVETGPTDYTCFAGECAQGTLVARALQWALGVDITFIASDTPQGSGWPAGNVSFSQAYKVFPAPAAPCKATIMGLRLWRLIDKSLSSSAFTTASISTGDTFLQMYGTKIEYSIKNGVGKAVSISIYNRTTSIYEPIDRLKYYTVASTNSECLYHSSLSPLLSASTLYRGETVQPVYSQQPMQEYISNFLTSFNPYTPILQNYYTAVASSEIDSGERSFLEYQTGLASCSSTQYYVSDVDSCFNCDPGYQRSSNKDAECEPTPIPTDKTPLIVGLTIAGFAVVAAIVAAVIYFEIRRRSNSRSNSNAPKGGKDPVAIVFTDIKSSTKLWGIAPISMGVALDTHHSVIREAIARHNGYEVKTVGDSFMIAIQGAKEAVDLAISIQQGLYASEWPSAIDDAYDCDFEDMDVVDDPEDLYGPEAGAPWSGLRVRIGVHFGPVEAVLDCVTKRYDYYGPTVNTAARIEGVTDGGQVCVSAPVFAEIEPVTPDYTSKLLSKTSLRGVRDSINLYELRGTRGLEGRTFNNPLIFDEAAISLNLRRSVVDSVSTTGSTAFTVGTQGGGVDGPMDEFTQDIRTSIQEACRAVRGSARTLIIETLRKAWRVELPSGGAFTGTTNSSSNKNGIHSSLSSRRHQSRSRKSTMGRSQRSRSGSTGPNGRAAMSGSTVVEQEDDEDIIFRVVAQRVAPRLKRACRGRSSFTNTVGDDDISLMPFDTIQLKSGSNYAEQLGTSDTENSSTHHSSREHSRGPSINSRPRSKAGSSNFVQIVELQGSMYSSGVIAEKSEI